MYGGMPDLLLPNTPDDLDLVSIVLCPLLAEGYDIFLHSGLLSPPFLCIKGPVEDDKVPFRWWN